MPSQIKHWRPVVTEWPLHSWLLPVLLGDRNQDHTNHKNHQSNGQQGRSEDVGNLLAVAGEAQAADNDATGQEAASSGHEVDGEPEDFTIGAGVLCGPEGLAAGQTEHGARCVARRGQLIPGLGERALSQGDVFWAAWHDLLVDSVEVIWYND